MYRYCKLRRNERVYPIKGSSLKAKELVARPTDKNAYRVRLYSVCVDTAKELIYSRLRIQTPGPGYVHMPEWVDEEYLAQLTAEKKLWKHVKGRGSTAEWTKLRERNEALDLTVYCLAALHILDNSHGGALIKALPERAARVAVPVEQIPPKAAPVRKPARNLIRKWRR